LEIVGPLVGGVAQW